MTRFSKILSRKFISCNPYERKNSERTKKCKRFFEMIKAVLPQAGNTALLFAYNRTVMVKPPMKKYGFV